MTDSMRKLLAIAAEAIHQLLAEAAQHRQFPEFDLWLVEELITDKEEEFGGEVPIGEKHAKEFVKRKGVILDAFDPKKVNYPLAFDFPYIILSPSGTIERYTNAVIDGKPYPCITAIHDSVRSVPMDYLTYACKALAEVERLPMSAEPQDISLATRRSEPTS